ncbi:hypothetical protein NKL05_34230 [Mesorhizobium sp. C420B]|uniref:hypothetical protein n=1 Tax=unclassified Mesorhizobium TaxID=325217 RepID=UPI0012EC56A5|nr:hypothetical protein [Mesorhizobium sp. LSHC420B00]
MSIVTSPATSALAASSPAITTWSNQAFACSLKSAMGASRFATSNLDDRLLLLAASFLPALKGFFKLCHPCCSDLSSGHPQIGYGALSLERA